MSAILFILQSGSSKMGDIRIGWFHIKMIG